MTGNVIDKFAEVVVDDEVVVEEDVVDWIAVVVVVVLSVVGGTAVEVGPAVVSLACSSSQMPSTNTYPSGHVGVSAVAIGVGRTTKLAKNATATTTATPAARRRQRANPQPVTSGPAASATSVQRFCQPVAASADGTFGPGWQ